MYQSYYRKWDSSIPFDLGVEQDLQQKNIIIP